MVLIRKLIAWWTYCTRVEGFGGFKPPIATGVYGSDLYEELLHISHNGKHQLWNLGLRCPIAQRIAKCASLGLRGSTSMKFVGKETLWLADPPFGRGKFHELSYV